MSKRVAYMGPHGSFSEQAALKYDPDAEHIPLVSFHAVADAVDKGVADEGIVPIENSLGGSVIDTLDLLIHDFNLLIRNELTILIKHCLLGNEGAATAEIDVVFSHPQALAQCRSFLSERFPAADLVASLSTSAAVQDMKNAGASAAAIADERTAAIYGVAVMAREIADRPNNITRFIVLAHTDHPPTGSDKTSLCISFSDDAPGLLHDVLGEFARRGINLAKVESRPTRESLGRYFFLVDLNGHRQDKLVQEALESVKQRVSMLKIFGSYPRYDPPPTQAS